VLDEQFAKTFFSSFRLCPSHRNNVKEKSYPAMTFYGEADGANFISVKN